jgi:hypothetical protein
MELTPAKINFVPEAFNAQIAAILSKQSEQLYMQNITNISNSYNALADMVRSHLAGEIELMVDGDAFKAKAVSKPEGLPMSKKERKAGERAGTLAGDE